MGRRLHRGPRNPPPVAVGFSPVLCGVVLLWLLLSLVLALWVRGDAPRHGMPPLLWFGVVLVLGLVGLLLYGASRTLGPRGGRPPAP